MRPEGQTLATGLEKKVRRPGCVACRGHAVSLCFCVCVCVHPRVQFASVSQKKKEARHTKRQCSSRRPPARRLRRRPPPGVAWLGHRRQLRLERKAHAAPSSPRPTRPPTAASRRARAQTPTAGRSSTGRPWPARPRAADPVAAAARAKCCSGRHLRRARTRRASNRRGAAAPAAVEVRERDKKERDACCGRASTGRAVCVVRAAARTLAATHLAPGWLASMHFPRPDERTGCEGSPKAPGAGAFCFVHGLVPPARLAGGPRRGRRRRVVGSTNSLPTKCPVPGLALAGRARVASVLLQHGSLTLLNEGPGRGPGLSEK